MRKYIVLLLIMIASSHSFAQNKSSVVTDDSILNDINSAMKSVIDDLEKIGRFKIYQTENIYTLLKLDTATGVIKIIQWSLDEEKEFEIYVNSKPLCFAPFKKGRFELYPTKNMYQFVLLDTLMGATWHVQWGTKEKEIWIRPISYHFES